MGSSRTMISENIKERKLVKSALFKLETDHLFRHQARAFLLLPASFMVASIIGPGKYTPLPVGVSSKI